jgi:hypothetical protein
MALWRNTTNANSKFKRKQKAENIFNQSQQEELQAVIGTTSELAHAATTTEQKEITPAKDARISSLILLIWTIIIIVITCISNKEAPFFHIGPSHIIYFLSIELNTWMLWCFGIIINITCSIVQIFILIKIYPIVFAIIGHDTAPETIFYDRKTAIYLIVTYILAYEIASLITIGTVSNQIDFFILNIFVQIVTFVTMLEYDAEDLKIVNKRDYNAIIKPQTKKDTTDDNKVDLEYLLDTDSETDH